MKILKSILSSLVIFIFGLEIGAFGMWYLNLKIMNESRRSSRNNQNRVSYHTYNQ